MPKKGGDKGSAKYQIYKILKNWVGKKKIIPLELFKNYPEKLKCSLANIGFQIRLARDAGYLKYDVDGDFILDKGKKIKDWDEFCSDLNAKANEARNKNKVKGPRAKKTQVPEDFKIDENTVIAVVQKIFDRNKELEILAEKFKRYALLMKEEKAELEKALEDMVE